MCININQRVNILKVLSNSFQLTPRNRNGLRQISSASYLLTYKRPGRQLALP